MIAVETNVLVAVHRRDNAFHGRAKPALDDLVAGGAPWAIPWPCVHEFYSIVTHPRKYRPPSGVERTLDQIAAWVDAGAVMIGEAADHLDRLRELVTDGHVVNGMVHDARIAAICLSHGVTELWTADRDFSRFPTLRTRNPLVAST